MDNNTEKDTDVILEVKDLKTYFKTGPHKVVKAVEGVNFSLRKGKVLGIIGESGSGKSVTARSILRIVESPGYIAGGEIRFKGQDILKLPEKEMKSIRGNEISMIFQDPTTSFNPYTYPIWLRKGKTGDNESSQACRNNQRRGGHKEIPV